MVISKAHSIILSEQDLDDLAGALRAAVMVAKPDPANNPDGVATAARWRLMLDQMEEVRYAHTNSH